MNPRTTLLAAALTLAMVVPPSPTSPVESPYKSQERRVFRNRSLKLFTDAASSEGCGPDLRPWPSCVADRS
jgi:hypothetical protein